MLYIAIAIGIIIAILPAKWFEKVKPIVWLYVVILWMALVAIITIADIGR